MVVEFVLNGHCIETAARKRYEQIVLELLKRDDEMLERELEFITEFLKKADFGELRRMGFDGSRKIRVRVKKVDGKFIVEEL